MSHTGADRPPPVGAGSPPAPIVDTAEPAARPTRAELRRAAEAEAGEARRSSAGSAAVVGAGDAVGAARATGGSRLEQRRLVEQRASAARRGNALWKAWWVYPLAAATVLFLYLGVQAASNAPNREPSVVTTVPDAP